MKLNKLILFIAALSLLLGGCKKDSVAVTGVSLDRTALSLVIGSKETLTATIAPDNATDKDTLIATIEPENATDKAVTWSSSNLSVATVNTNGEINAISVGTATITVKTHDGNKSDGCQITVIDVDTIDDDPIADYEDFGVEATVSKIFNVYNTNTWESATSYIINNGDNKNYVINIVYDFTMDGESSYYTFGSQVTNVKVSIRGNKTITLSSNGSLLRINNQTIIMRETHFVGKSGNNSPLVYCEGTFIMNSGTISGNSTYSSGGGVYCESGSFTMNGGTISGNTTSFYCGGVYIHLGTFAMNGGMISGNTTAYNGGGIYLAPEGTLIMSGGTISDNKARMGGGVYSGGFFTMSGGTISGNKTSYNGGGVTLIDEAYYCKFTKTGNSIIYGNISATHIEGSNNNTTTWSNSGAGHAVYVLDGKYRDATAEAGVDMSWDSTTAVGFEN